MSLTTQVCRYVLVGDLADRPDPATVAIGHLFRALDTGACSILVQEPSTGVRLWEEFCAGGAGPTGEAGPEGPEGAAGSSGNAAMLMKFAVGRQWPGELGTSEKFMADDIPENISGVVEGGSSSPLGYSVPDASTSQVLIYNVSLNSLDQDATLNLYNNNVLVTAITLTAGTTGSVVVPLVAAFASEDLVDVSVALSVDETNNATLMVAVTILFNP